MSSGEFALIWLLALAAVAYLFVVPSIIAFRRGHPNRWPILAVNICLGGTGIGWAAALIWALYAVHRSNEPGGSHGGESGLNVFTNDVRRVHLITLTADPSRPLLTTGAMVAEIERLKALRDAGHLSEAEFTGLKSTVLARC